jgi:DNA-directed RNA polymerase specialized sigma24 family protein
MSEKWSMYSVVDPYEISSRYTEDDSWAYLETCSEEVSEVSEALLLKIKSVMDDLPLMESDFIELYFFKKMRQTAIAKIYRVSQPTVCYRLQRAIIRIKFLLERPNIPLEEIESAVKKCLSDKLDIDIMRLMAHTTCQSETAKRLGISQGMVRYRFFRSLGKMKNVQGMHKYVKYFEVVSRNLNKMREVSLEDHNDPVTRIID